VSAESGSAESGSAESGSAESGSAESGSAESGSAESGACMLILRSDCEPFVLERIPKPPYAHSNELGYSCKTNRRPYDTVVCAVLIRAKQLLGNAFYAG